MDLKTISYAQSTALVTGGSSGIGRAIAAELVARGIKKIVIVAQNEEKLEHAAFELQQAADGVDVRSISIDLARHDAPAEVQHLIESWGWQVDLIGPHGVVQFQS